YGGNVLFEISIRLLCFDFLLRFRLRRTYRAIKVSHLGAEDTKPMPAGFTFKGFAVFEKLAHRYLAGRARGLEPVVIGKAVNSMSHDGQSYPQPIVRLHDDPERN